MDFLKKIGKIICTKQILGTALVVIIAIILGHILNKIISKTLVTNRNTFEIKRRKTIINL